MRRVSTREELGAANINRIVVAMNRAQLTNRRAALAAMASALLVAFLTAANVVALL